MLCLGLKQGTVIKGVAGFYYVQLAGEDMIIQCRARGKFRNIGQSPVVGDEVEIGIINNSNEGTIENILPRKNILKRPLVSNVDKVAVVFAVKNPDINFHLLDKILIFAQKAGIQPLIVLNKIDLVDKSDVVQIERMYKNIGYDVVCTSLISNIGVNKLKSNIKGCKTVLAGPSGAGKSSLINMLVGKQIMQTGKLSQKIKRGRHTTRHSELLKIYDDSYIVDAPGFNNLDLKDIKKQELQYYFIDFNNYIDLCKFKSCLHVNEPDCAVKRAVNQDLIYKNRYKRYLEFIKEIELGGMNKW